MLFLKSTHPRVFSGTLFPVSMINLPTSTSQCGMGNYIWMDGLLAVNLLLMNKEKALRSVLAITHILCCQVLYLLL